MTTLAIDGTDLYCEDAGTGPPVVLVHGWGTSARVWAAQQAALAADHRVVAYDLRGCGRSGRPATGNTIARNAADLAELCARLGLDRPVLVGSSVGASIATEAALAAPDRVAAVVAIDGPGHWPSTLPDDRLGQVRAALAADRAGTVAGWVAGWYGAGAGPELVAWTVRQILDSGPFIDDLLADQLPYDPRAALAATALPVCFVHGRDDAQVPVAVAAELAGLTPGGELVVVDGAGHMPHQERPAAVTTTIRAVVERAVAGAAP
jgi:non-heme chloroperoxidase